MQDESIRRDTAWAKSYRKPERCNEAPSSEMLVQCANEYIRARPAFESAYAQGKLRPRAGRCPARLARKT